MEQPNQAPPGAPLDAPIYSVTVEQAAALYEQAGLSRTIRRIQKYCERKDLDCIKPETPTGKRYLITAISIERHIAQSIAERTAAGHAPTRPDASGRSLETKEISKEEEGAPHNGQARPGASERPLETKEFFKEEPATPPNAPAQPGAPGRDYKDLYIHQLEIDNAFFREQIPLLIDSVKQTNVLTLGVQQLVTRLLNSPNTPDKGEGDLPR